MIDMHVPTPPPTPQEFLEIVFEGYEENEAVLIAKPNPDPDKQGFVNAAFGTRKFDAWIRQGGSLYFNTSTVTPADYLRRRKQDCQLAYCIVLDDVGTKVEPNDIEPSWILETSPGNQQWGYLINPTDRLAEVAELIQSLAKAGYTDAGTKGYSRLMRMPGSLNLKNPDKPFTARLLHWAPELIYEELEDMAAEFGVPMEPPAPERTVQDLSPLALPEGAVIVDPLLEWLFAEGLVTSQDGEWFNIICPNADEHSDGNPVARYSPLGYGKEMGHKVRRQFKCFHEHCKDIKTPDVLAAFEKAGAPRVFPYDPLPVFQESYALVGNSQRVCNLQRVVHGGIGQRDMALADFGTLWSHVKVPRWDPDQQQIEYVTLRKAFVNSEDTTRVSGYTSAPHPPNGKPKLEYVLDRGELYLNTYRPPHHTARPAHLDVFLDHIDYLLPDQEERELFLDWLAFKLQNPCERSFGVIMVAETFGIGRSWVASVLRKVWGESLTRSIDIGELTGRGNSSSFNGWMSGSQLVTIEEALDGSDETAYRAYEHIKTIVDTSPSMVHINEKYGTKREEMIYFNTLILSNHADAINLPAGDRRFAVLRNPDKKRTEAEYANMFNTLRDHGDALASAVYGFLKERDVSNFNASTPPATEAKDEMIEDSESPAEKLAKVVIAKTNGDLVTKDIVKRLVRDAERLAGNELSARVMQMAEKLVWRRTAKLTEGRNGYRHRMDDGERVIVRAIRNGEYWFKKLEGIDAPNERHGLVNAELAKTGTRLSKHVHTEAGVIPFPAE